MKLVIAIDSFKGSMTSVEAGTAAAEGIRRVLPSAGIDVRPLADGGEGTVEALTLGMGGKLHTVRVTGPLDQKVDAVYGILPDQTTAIIEMSAAAGITLVPAERRNPLYTTTFGVGEMIRDAIAQGCRSFLIGIGGSATNDGGIGMLQALGYKIEDQNGQAVPRGAIGLSAIDHITCSGSLPELQACTFRIACDVTNPLCGIQGCSAVFGPQKGATPDMIRQMDRWLEQFAAKTKEIHPEADPNAAGAGAAGGLGFAFLSYTNAALRSGVALVLEETHLEESIKASDLVITGEGCLDRQTVMGKAPIGVARLAKKYGIPVVAVSGSVSEDASVCNDQGIDAFFPILRRITTLEEAMAPDTARRNMADTLEQIMRLLQMKSLPNLRRPQ